MSSASPSERADAPKPSSAVAGQPAWFMALCAQFSAYTLVSVVALSADLICFYGALSAGVGAAVAGAIGYAIGLVLHYGLSMQFVFAVGPLEKSGVRRLLEFVLSGCVGLALTWGVIRLATDLMHLPPLVSKCLAIGISFVAVFILRRGIVFAGDRPGTLTARLDHSMAALAHTVSPHTSAVAVQVVRYALTSGTALVVDVACYAALLAAGVQAVVAGALSFIVGIVVHYLIGTRFVFDTRYVRRTPVQLFAEYASAGTLGLLVTTAVIAFATSPAVALHPFAAKIAAIGVNFIVVFITLRKVVFRADVPRQLSA